MAVRQYIGARYVPIVMGEWDNTKEYEPLSIVTYQGASYTSRQFTPTGIAITNDEYWALTGDYNAQIAAYRQDVDTINNALPIADFSSASTVKDAIDSVASDISDLADLLPASDFDSVNTVKSAIEAAGSNVDDLLPASDFDSVNTVKAAIDSVASDLVVVENRLDGIQSLMNHFVVIGDSFSVTGHNSVGSSDIWWGLIKTITGMTPHCYAVNGCGYIRGTTPFASQVALAAADTSYDHNDVGYVFVYGSLNDCYSAFTDTEYRTQLGNVYSAIRSAFPNARIIIAAMNTSQAIYSRLGFVTPGGLTIAHSTRGLETLQQEFFMKKPRCTFVPFSRIMCAVEEYFGPSDAHHPNATGQNVIAHVMYNAMVGGQTAYKFQRAYQIAPAFGSGQIQYNWNDSYIAWYAATVTAAETSSGSGYYAAVWPVPYGLEGLYPVTLSGNSCVSLAATRAQPRTAVAYGFFQEELPTYVTDYTPSSGLYIQSYIVQGAPSSASCGVHSL